MQTFGLLGHPLGHTFSPRLHGMIYRETGVDGAYGTFDVPPERVGQVVESLRVLGIRGMNVTMPYKQVIMQQLDEISPEAKKIGAVNTVDMRPDGTVVGHNTDYWGFIMQLRRHGIEVSGRRFVMCGMSGAGRAIHQALEDEGAAEILVASTDPAKGVSYDSLKGIKGYDTIVNCTPVGMHPRDEDSVVGEEVLARFDSAVDIVYNPLETKFLKMARARGLRTSAGLLMLVYQGIRAFEIWTGVQIDEAAADRIHDELQQIFR